MPVVRWQGLKAATGKWQHRCRKDDCDTSENPSGNNIKASSYVYQVPSCWNMQWAFTPAGYCSASSPSCQCTVNHFCKTRDPGKPFPLSRKRDQEINLISTSHLIWTWWDRKLSSLHHFPSPSVTVSLWLWIPTSRWSGSGFGPILRRFELLLKWVFWNDTMTICLSPAKFV